ncbi:MAG: hypothetical protein NC035_09115 [Bacteroides sp.]|nr:hypothetical protein [Bacteroides sp.]
MGRTKMTLKCHNLSEFLSQPGQTVVDLMRDFNKERIKCGLPRVSASTFYGWCRGDYFPTKEWDMITLEKLTGIPADKLFENL